MTKIDPINEFAKYQKLLNKSELTIINYRTDISVFAKWFNGQNAYLFATNKITPTDIRLYKQYLIKHEYKPNTINRKLLGLKYFINWAIDTNQIKHHFPFPKPVKDQSITAKWLDRLEQNALLRHIEQYGKERDVAIVKILLNTGLRVQELCDLKWKHIIITDRKGHLYINYGKGDKSRTVPLNQSARLAFKAIGYDINIGSKNFVFIGQRGPLTPRGVQFMLKQLLARTHLAHISPHHLRHTFCKNLVDSGATLEKVAILAGHESLDTTKIYCRPSHADLSEAVERISEIE